MSSNRDMSGQVLNREAMELYSEKDTDDKQCLSQKYLEQATPYLLCFLSIMVCVLGGAIYQAHMETGLLEEEIVTLRQSMDKVESSRGEKGERGGSGLPGLPGMNGQKGRPGLAGFRGQDGIPGLDGESGQKGGAGDIGPDGTPGLKGEQGGKGDRGEFGKKGEVGSPGASGTRGLKGERGSIGPVGPMGETLFNGTDIEVEGPPGPKGEIGEQGEKGEKGDSVTIADPFVWTQASGNKNERYDFKVECLTKCKDLEVTIKHKTGDVDLYGKAETVPSIVNSNCADCPDCKARSSKPLDKCKVGRVGSRIFYVVVWAHKNFRDLEVDIDAANLQKVTGPL